MATLAETSEKIKSPDNEADQQKIRILENIKNNLMQSNNQAKKFSGFLLSEYKRKDLLDNYDEIRLRKEELYRKTKIDLLLSILNHLDFDLGKKKSDTGGFGFLAGAAGLAAIAGIIGEIGNSIKDLFDKLKGLFDDAEKSQEDGDKEQVENGEKKEGIPELQKSVDNFYERLEKQLDELSKNLDNIINRFKQDTTGENKKDSTEKQTSDQKEDGTGTGKGDDKKDETKSQTPPPPPSPPPPPPPATETQQNQEEAQQPPPPPPSAPAEVPEVQQNNQVVQPPPEAPSSVTVEPRPLTPQKDSNIGKKVTYSEPQPVGESAEGKKSQTGIITGVEGESGKDFFYIVQPDAPGEGPILVPPNELQFMDRSQGSSDTGQVRPSPNDNKNIPPQVKPEKTSSVVPEKTNNGENLLDTSTEMAVNEQVANNQPPEQPIYVNNITYADSGDTNTQEMRFDDANPYKIAKNSAFA